ncbi:MAG: hypothetical protein PHH60_01560, partial [Candidatus Margulisbacteria bacterium]|nr:hypothetical protein [Candidatus Margulisiibacteriota bacterium]
TSLDLKLKLVEADLASAVDLAQKIQGEFSRRLSAVTAASITTIDLSSLSLPDPRRFTKKHQLKLYSANGEKVFFLKSWGKIEAELKKNLPSGGGQTFGGKLSGDLTLKGKIKDLAGKFTGEVKNGFYQKYNFDSLKAEAALADQKIQIKKFDLTKKRRVLSSRGQIGLDGSLALYFSAQKMPLDFLQIFFDKDFKGEVDLSASLEGTVQNFDFWASAAGRGVTLADVNFDQVSLLVAKKKNALIIHELALVDSRKRSTVRGLIDLSPAGQLKLSLNLNNDALGLLNLFTEELKWRKGTASASLEVAGTAEDLKLNGRIKLKDTTVYARALNSEIKNISGEAAVINSQLKTAGLSGFWQGKSSRDYPNFLGLAGSINLNKMLARSGRVSLNLVFSPTYLFVDFPDLYSGAVKITDAQLIGPFAFDFSRGPVLKGKAEISNALITLSSKGGGAGKTIPLNFDLTLGLKKNVYAVMGDVATLDFSNIFMNLEINSDQLEIKGSLKTPSLRGKINLKRGTVSIFNREFSLLSPDQQKTYYPYDADKIKDNTAVFTSDGGLMPNINLVAQVDVENLEKDASGQLVKKKVIIITNLKGVIGAVEKDRWLNLTFDSFVEDKTNSPPEMKPANYSDQDIKVMLLPDFIKSLTGISKDQRTGVETNVIVADYLSSRVSTMVFRGIERNLEQSLGLESLTLEYNFGKDIRQAMGVNENHAFEEEKPDWRVGFAKGFFDKLYIDVKYSQALADTGVTETFLNYQLTYKLSPIWSIIYYREPISLQEINTGYQKVTLKAGFSFW